MELRRMVSFVERKALYELKAGPAGGPPAGWTNTASYTPRRCTLTGSSSLPTIEAAKTPLRAWAGANGVPLVQVDFVVPFVETDFSLGVWLFYDTDRSVADLDRDGTTARVQQEFLSILGAGGYPAAWLPPVTFAVDSHENVERIYEGSYFYRLR
jgi:hypothetical protein